MFRSDMWRYALAFIGCPGVLDILGFPDFPGVLGSLGSLGGFESRRLDILGDPDFLRVPSFPLLCYARLRLAMLCFILLGYVTLCSDMRCHLMSHCLTWL